MSRHTDAIHLSITITFIMIIITIIIIISVIRILPSYSLRNLKGDKEGRREGSGKSPPLYRKQKDEAQ